MGAHGLSNFKWKEEIEKNTLQNVAEIAFFWGGDSGQSGDKMSLALSVYPKIIAIVRKKNAFFNGRFQLNLPLKSPC